MPWTETPDAALHYQISGEGPPLVLLHEMGGCLQSWDWVVPLLPGYRLLRPDQRGAGLSEKITAPLTIEHLVADLAAVIEAANLEGPVALAGCAVGAAVALAFAARHPNRAASVVAMAPATGLRPEARPAALAIADAVERHGMRPRVLDRLDDSFPPRYRTDPTRFAAFRAMHLGHDPHSYAAIYRMLAHLDLMADLPRIACPCLLLAGETDTLRPPALVEALAATIPGSRAATIASGHFMPMLTPELVARSLQESFP